MPPHEGLEECAELTWTCMELVLGCFVDPDLCVCTSAVCSKCVVLVVTFLFQCSKFAAQDLSHVRLWRTAIEYHPASNSSEYGMPIFGRTAAYFCMEKKKVQPSWQHRWAVTASCELFLLRTLTVKHVAAFLKSSYLRLQNYSLDMLLFFSMNLELHLSLQITYTDPLQ